MSKPLSELDGKTLPDDPYLCWSISKSIAEGKGPLYGDNFTNGFQPFYVFATVPFFYFFPGDLYTPIRLSLAMLSLFDTATLLILLLWIRRLTDDAVITFLSAVFWVFNDYIIRTSLNGMETIMASFFILWSCYYFYLLYYILPTQAPKHFFYLGIITGFACFTRVDSGLLALIIGLTIFYNERYDLKKFLLRASWFSMGVLLIFSIWMVYSIYYTGDWYPESGKAVRFISLAGVENTGFKFYRDLIYTALYLEIKENGTLLGMIIAYMAYSTYKKTFSITDFTPASVLFFFSLFIFLAYVFYIFTSWYFDRYFFPFTILFIVLTAMLLKTVKKTLPQSRLPYLYVIILLTWFFTLGWKERYIDYYTGTESKYLGYMNLGLWVNENLPAGSVVGSAQSGALGYFATKQKILNLDGVVNNKTYRSMVEKRNMEFIKEQNVDYVIGWEANIKFIKNNSRNFKESDLIFLRKIKSFQSWKQNWYLFKVNK